MIFMNSNSLRPCKNRIHDHFEAKAPQLRTQSKTLARPPNCSRIAARFWTAATESAESPLWSRVQPSNVRNTPRPTTIEGKAATPLRSSPHSKTLARSSWILSIILLGVFAVSLPLHAVPRYRESHLLLKWQDGPESYAAAVGNSVIGSTVKRNFNTIGWQLVELPPDMSVRDGMEAYQQLGTVLAAEPDGIIEAILPPLGRAVRSAPVEEDDTPADDGAVGRILTHPPL